MKLKSYLSSLLLLCCLSLHATVYNGTCGANLTWTLDTETRVLEISGTGAMDSAPWATYGSSIETVVINSGVTNIGDLAFYGIGLKSISIPNTVTSIGYFAFAFAGLTSITFPNSLTDIRDFAFYACGELSPTIPNSVRSIGDGAFWGCGLTSVTIPSGVTNIGGNPFSGNHDLTSLTVDANNTIYDSRDNCNAIIKTATNELVVGCKITNIPTSVTSIGYDAFAQCGITSISIPNSVTRIGAMAFYDTGLTSISIPNSVTSLEEGVFCSFYALTSVIIGSGVTNISNRVFDGYSNNDLSHVYCYANLANLTWGNPNSGFKADKATLFHVYDAEAWTTAYPTANVTFVGDLASVEHACGENITWKLSEDGVLNISGTGAITDFEAGFNPWFGGSIKEVVISADITHIGNNAFDGCADIESITCDAATPPTIGANAFASLSTNTIVYVPSAVSASYQDDAIWGQFEIREILSGSCGANLTWTLKDSVLTISGTGAMSGYPSWPFDRSAIASLVMEDGVTSVGESAFDGCSKLSTIVFPESLTSIGGWAFRGCSNLSSVNIPAGVTSIGSYAFDGCSSLSSIVIPTGVTSIEGTFRGCSSLSSIVIPDGVTSFGLEALRGCSNLTSITIPSSVTNIGWAALGSCSRLSIIRMLSTSVPSLAAENDFYVAVIIVPAASLDAYRSATNWSAFANQILPDNVQTDYNVTLSAMDNRSALEAEITDPLLINVVKLKITGTINGYDIMVIRNKMLNLHELDLEDATIVSNPYEYYTGCHTEDNKLGDNSFLAMHKLTKVILPSTITSIGNSAFFECITLPSIIIPDGVTSIGSDAFGWCSSLSSIIMPNGVTSIGQRAFNGCNNLISFTIPNNVTRIEDWVFYGCYNLQSITIPSGIESIGNDAFGGTSLSSVYVKMVDPISISQSSFSTATFQNATLYIPRNEEWDATYQKYYYNTQWSQFAHLDEWDPTFTEFNVDSDYNLDGGTIQGEDEVDENGDPVLDEHGYHKKHHPRGNFHPGCGFLVDNTGHQHLREGHLHHNGSQCGSLIGDERQWNDGNNHDAEANLIIDTLYCDIEVEGNRWYFFTFPFDVQRNRMQVPGNHVMYEYNGARRASYNSASGNWQEVLADSLFAGKGYIFQCSQSGILSIPMHNPNFTAEAPHALEQHACSNAQNANWNFVGNPYTSYYQLEDINYDAPITVWNGNSYEAVRPGDDDYTFRPFEGYFVQQPDAQTTHVGHDRSKRETYNQSREHAQHAAERRAMQQVNPDRLLVNLTISDGENTDKTRIVYNDAHTMDYELNCDAAKFFSSEAVPQIYSTYAGVNYSINERPKGSYEAQLGIRVPADGTYTISVTRMDVPLLLEDHLTGNIHDLTLGGYSFSAEEGYNATRFSVRINNDETSLADFLSETGVSIFASEGKLNITGITDNAVNIYSAGGQQVAEMTADGLISVPTGTYLVQVGNTSTKVLVK